MGVCTDETITESHIDTVFSLQLQEMLVKCGAEGRSDYKKKKYRMLWEVYDPGKQKVSY